MKTGNYWLDRIKKDLASRPATIFYLKYRHQESKEEAEITTSEIDTEINKIYQSNVNWYAALGKRLKELDNL